MSPVSEFHNSFISFVCSLNILLTLPGLPIPLSQLSESLGRFPEGNIVRPAVLPELIREVGFTVQCKTLLNQINLSQVSPLGPVDDNSSKQAIRVSGPHPLPNSFGCCLTKSQN